MICVKPLLISQVTIKTILQYHKTRDCVFMYLFQIKTEYNLIVIYLKRLCKEKHFRFNAKAISDKLGDLFPVRKEN